MTEHARRAAELIALSGRTSVRAYESVIQEAINSAINERESSRNAAIEGLRAENERLKRECEVIRAHRGQLCDDWLATHDELDRLRVLAARWGHIQECAKVSTSARRFVDEAIRRHPETDDLHSPEFLTKRDAEFLLAAEKTESPTEHGKTVPRRHPEREGT